MSLALLTPALGLAVTLSLALVAWLIARLLLVPLVSRAVSRSHSAQAAALMQSGALRIATWLVPLLTLQQGLRLMVGLPTSTHDLVRRVVGALVILVGAMTVSALISAGGRIYELSAARRNRPIKGYLQVAKLLVAMLACLLVVAELMNQQIGYFLTGIGALTAVFLLVFRDTLLSLVAGVQITTTGIVRIGDWITMPEFGADGTVIDIALHTVQVQNFDNTLTAIPTHAFMGHAFVNWRGMHESGSRRIMRTLVVHVSSIRFCDAELLERLWRIDLLRPYLSERVGAAAAGIVARSDGYGNRLNGRPLTNIGCFRAYCSAYLRSLRTIRQDQLVMVRQLEPGPTGLPLQIYAFAATVDWEAYEATQSEIFDHLLAAIADFDLLLFQHPSGHDIRRGLPAADVPVVIS